MTTRTISSIVLCIVLGLAAAAQAATDTVYYWDKNASGNWSDYQDSTVVPADTTGWSDITSDGIGDIPDDLNLSDGVNAIARFAPMTGRTITLDSSRTVACVWFNWNGTTGATASGGMTLNSSGGSILTLAREGGTPEIHIGYRYTSGNYNIGMTINTVLAGTQGFTIGSPSTDSYGGFGLVLGAANTVSGTVSGGRRLTLTNVAALRYATRNFGTSTFGLRNDTDNATFVLGEGASYGLTQSTTNATVTINVDQATAAGDTGHTLKLDADYYTDSGNGDKTWNITGGNDYKFEMMGTMTNAHATAALVVNANSANTKLSGDIAVGNGGMKLGGLAATGVNEVSGIMSGDGGVTKSGDSTWKLSGNNTYTGATTISDGTLLVTGTTSGQGDFGFGTLSADATLGGTGTIGLAADKNLTVVGVSDDAKAIVAPGASVGTLNVSTSGTGTTTFGDYSVLSIELTDDTVDLLSVGALDLSSTLDTLQLTVTGTQTQMRYVFVQYTGSLNSETFDLSDFSGLPVGASIDYGTAGEIAVVLIPEPATLTLLGLGACGVLLRRRRNR